MAEPLRDLGTFAEDLIQICSTTWWPFPTEGASWLLVPHTLGCPFEAEPTKAGLSNSL